MGWASRQSGVVREQMVHQLCKSLNSSPHHSTPEHVAQSTQRKGAHFSHPTSLRTEEGIKQLPEGRNEPTWFEWNCVLKVERRLPRLHPRRAERAGQHLPRNWRFTRTLLAQKVQSILLEIAPPLRNTFEELNTWEGVKVEWGSWLAGLKSLVVAPGLIFWCRCWRSIPATDSIPWSITATECGHHWYHYSSGRPMLWSRILEQKKTEINSWQSLRLLSVYNQKLYSSSVALCV